MMSHSHSSRPAYLRVVAPEPAATPADAWPPLPVMVPLLHPDEAITPRQEALVTMLAQRARQGDQAANQLLWRALEARLEPAVSGCAHATRQGASPRRDGQPWVQEDVRQEAFLVFCDLTATWEGAESYVSYISALPVAELSPRDARRVTVRAAILFVAGFTLIFSLLGAASGLVGAWLLSNLDTIIDTLEPSETAEHAL